MAQIGKEIREITVIPDESPIFAPEPSEAPSEPVSVPEREKEPV